MNPGLSAAALADQIKFHVREGEEDRYSELQVAVAGHSSQRARYIALALFIATTDYDYFRSLIEAPSRDVGSPKGILIKGETVQEDLARTETPGERLDYLIPFPQGKWAKREQVEALIRNVHHLSFGLYLADTLQVRRLNALSPVETAIANRYIEFERRLVRILRRYDRFRNTADVYSVPDQWDENRGRVEALEAFRLEEALYPQRNWVVDLAKYNGGEDDHWNELLPYLRRVEATLLTRTLFRENAVGENFVSEVRDLVSETSDEIEALWEGRLGAGA